MVWAVSLCCYLHTVLKLLDRIIDLSLLEEGEAIREVEYPGTRMIAWKSCKYFHGLEVIVGSLLRIIQITKMFVEIRVRNRIGNIVLPHLLLPNFYCPCDIFLKGDRFSHADQHCSLLLINGSHNCTTVHVLYLYLRYLLGDLQLLQGEVVLQLAVEYLHL